MGLAVRVQRAVTVSLEIAHRGLDGVLHGHSLTVEVWTDSVADLDALKAQVQVAVAHIQGQLEDTINGRSFEDVGVAVLADVQDACRAVVRVPTRGHVVEVTREAG